MPEVLDSAVSCPCCGGQDLSELYCKIVQGQSLSIAICEHCACGFQLSPPSNSEIDAYYTSQDVFFGRGPGSRQEVFNARRWEFIYTHVREMPRLQVKPLVADVGCGYGDFLGSFDASTWRRTGFELNARRASFGRSHFGLDIRECRLEEAKMEPGSVDLLCAISLIEHLRHPREFLAHVSRVLSPKGVGFISVPDTLKPIVAISDVFSWEHVLYFTATTLKLLLETSGFRVLKTGTSQSSDFPDVACLFRCTGAEGPACPPGGIPSQPEEVRRLKETIRLWKERRDRLTINMRNKLLADRVLPDVESLGIFGAGSHTRQLVECFPELRGVKAFFDSDQSKWGSAFLNGKVHSVSEAPRLKLDRILISSKAFEHEIARQVRGILPPTIRIIGLYDSRKLED